MAEALEGRRNILVIRFSSLGAAYLAAQDVENHVDIFEILPLGMEGHILFYSALSLTEQSQKIATAFAKDIVQMNLIENCAHEVLKAYMSVDNAALDKNLLIMEDVYVGRLMQAAQLAHEQSLGIVDLRMLRGAASSSYLFLTGKLEALRVFADQSELKTTVVADVCSKLSEFFPPQPNHLP